MKLIIVFLILVECPTHHGLTVPRCEASHDTVEVGSDPQTVTSPGFPDRYPNDHQCSILIQTRDTDDVMHVEVMHMHLNSWNDTCQDKLTAYHGNSTNGSILTTWCSSDYTPMTSPGNTLLLVFTSDAQIQGQGFALRIWSQKPVDLHCHSEEREVINIGQTAMFFTLPGDQLDTSDNNCSYVLTSGYTDSSVKLSIRHWDVEEGHCALYVYDDCGTQLLNWSSVHQPVSEVTSSGRSIVLDLTYNMTSSSVVVMMFTTIKKDNSCNTEKVIEVTTLPSIFWYYNSATEPPCPLKLISTDVHKSIRIEVLSDPENMTDQIHFTDGTQDGVSILPPFSDSLIYRSNSPVIYISTNDTMLSGPIPLKVQILDNMFNGEVMVKSAIQSSVLSDIIFTEIPSNAYTVYNITAVLGMEIQLELPGQFLHSDEDCPGGSLLTRHLSGAPDGRERVNIWCPGSNGSVFWSRESYLSFVIMTRDIPWSGEVKGHYYALKSSATCSSELQYREVRPKLMSLMSPNFPNSYFVNHDCRWLLYAYRVNFVVIVNVTMVDLPDDCSDLLYVVDGHQPTDKKLGRVCGSDNSHFRSTSRFMLLRFTSNSHTNMGGFEIQYTSEHRTGGQRSQGGPPVIIIAGACIALAVVAGIIYVLVNENRKKHKRKKTDLEEY